jgi:hypothetical protein
MVAAQEPPQEVVAAVIPAVLLIFFRRPEQTARVFEAIRKARPGRLYLAADGPRPRPGEAEACAACRALVSSVDWPCEVKTLFRDTNAGIRRNVAEAVTWFLGEAGEGIILEDDCLPSPEFFRFAAEGLDRYRDDKRVSQICGTSFVSRKGRTESYYFSRYGHGWGWATWKRAWDLLDLEMESLEAFLEEADQTEFWDSCRERKYWRTMFRRTRDLPIDTWDYQWVLSQWKAGALSVYPNRNLVTNLGFHELASNTVDSGSPKGGKPLEPLGGIVHPTMVLRDTRSDRKTFLTYYWGHPWDRWKSRVRTLLKLLGGWRN